MGIHLSPEAWQELETEYRAGAPAKKLAQKYRVSPDTIFARSSRNKWRDSPIRPAEPTYVERLECVAIRLENVARVLLSGREK